MSFLCQFARIIPAAALTLSIFAAGTASAQTSAPLTLKVYNADAHSFHVNAVVVSGQHEALVIDTGFTRADAYRIAADVLDTGKTLKTILISNADPDYYFGAEVLKGLFPQAEVVTTPAVRKMIKAKLPTKVGFWRPRMSAANAPQQPIVPSELKGTALTIDGEAIEIRGVSGELAHRPYVWIPSLRAIVGNVAVFSQLHVWTADTSKPSERKAWLAQLDEMQALEPSVVVPGHMAADTALDRGAIRYTRDYLLRFDAETAKVKNATGLIEAMKKAYPEAGLDIALDIGAKVAKGEMKW